MTTPDTPFAAALVGVKRMKPSDRLPPVVTAPPDARPRSRERDDAEVLAALLEMPDDPADFESGDTLSYRAPGIQDGVLRKLRRGQYRVQGELDLHGCTRDLARVEVLRFLAHCRDRNHRCVRVIHGKGNGSPNSGPVLKRLLDGWLRKRRDVLAFCTARPVDGGIGAIYLLLRAGTPTAPE